MPKPQGAGADGPAVTTNTPPVIANDSVVITNNLAVITNESKVVTFDSFVITSDPKVETFGLKAGDSGLPFTGQPSKSTKKRRNTYGKIKRLDAGIPNGDPGHVP
jgi:hypothetical protein